MKKLPRVRVESINFDVLTEKALIVTIDVFRFTHLEYSDYVIVEDEYGEGCDFIDEIEISNSDISIKNLESIALKWIFEHVEIMK